MITDREIGVTYPHLETKLQGYELIVRNGVPVLVPSSDIISDSNFSSGYGYEKRYHDPMFHGGSIVADFGLQMAQYSSSPTSFDTALNASFVADWHLALDKLVALQSNPDVEDARVTDLAFLRALWWLIFTYRNVEKTDPPDVVPDGEGGVDFEWESEQEIVSIHIASTSEGLSTIYYQNANEHKAMKLTKANLREAVSKAM